MILATFTLFSSNALSPNFCRFSPNNSFGRRLGKKKTLWDKEKNASDRQFAHFPAMSVAKSYYWSDISFIG